MRGRLTSVLLAGVLALSGAIGCGGEEESDPEGLDEALSQLEKAAKPDKNSAPSQVGSSGNLTGASAAQALLRDYFALINAGSYETAWSHLDGAVQAQFGGFDSWSAGYSGTDTTRVIDTDVTSESSQAIDLEVRIRACAGGATEEFEGPWTVSLDTQQITAASFSEVTPTGSDVAC